MQNVRSILKAYSVAKESGKRTALATVVRVVGSAYRSPGAKMLIVEGGETVGTISGGCLEKDLVLRAAEILKQGKSALLHYSTSGSDDDIVFGVGAGCSGSVDVLVEPDSSFTSLDPLQFHDACLVSRSAGIVATVYLVDRPNNVLVGDRVSISADGTVKSTIANRALTALVAKSGAATLSGLRSTWARLDAGGVTAEVFFEVVQPAIKLIVCGNGQEVSSLATIARQLDWDLVVLTTADDATCEIERARLDRRTAVAILTHNYWRDVEFLRHFACPDLGYIGLLGPRHRTDRILQELLALSQSLSPDSLSRLYAPIGLDLGAETESEIALSIVSEIQAVMHEGSGASLRDRGGSIHGRRSAPQSTPLTCASSTFANIARAASAACRI